MVFKIKEVLKKNNFINDVAKLFYTNYYYLKKEKRLKIQLKQKEKELENSLYVPVVHSNQISEKILILKEETKEAMPLSKVYGIIEGGKIYTRSPELDVWKVSQAIVFPYSDMILLDKKCIWDKAYQQRFEITIPLDYDLLNYKEGFLNIRKPCIENTIDVAFSLCGVHIDQWSHFIAQYLPKLYILSQLQTLVNEKIVVIIPEIKDPHIMQLIENAVSKINYIELYRVKRGETVLCRKLYYMDKVSYIMEHSLVHGLAAWNFSEYFAELLRDNLFKYLDIEVKEWEDKVKLYLGREGEQRRTLKNEHDVQDYFVSQGFQVVIPHKMTLEEKVNLFWNASIIIGCGGSAMTNRIFCRPGTKCMIFSGYPSISQTMEGCIDKYWGIDGQIVVGESEDASNGHSNYYIPLERIKTAYNDLMKPEAER